MPKSKTNIHLYDCTLYHFITISYSHRLFRQRLPVRFMISCRVEFDQQEMCHYVEGIFVWSIKHVPVNIYTTI